ncbi:WxL domain-containing protein [Leuconostoc pseudomesenteroides]|uniref:WxL domain-containing protein n=1 Tax=Leuconostoc pseudomesenteroides TaxID=33968 RepID=UPI00345EC03F
MTSLQKVSTLAMASAFLLSVAAPVSASADTVDTLQGDAHLVITSNGGADPVRPTTTGSLAMTGVPSFDFGTHKAGMLNDDGTFTVNGKAVTGSVSGSAKAAPAVDTSATLKVNDMRGADKNAWSINAQVDKDLTTTAGGNLGMTSFKMTVADGADGSHVKGESAVDIHGAAAKIASHDDSVKSVYDEESGKTSAEMTLPTDAAVGDYHANITYTLSDGQ